MSKHLSKARGSANHRVTRSPQQTASPSLPSTPADWAVRALAALTIAVTGVKLYKAMHVPVNVGRVAVVYNARRRSIFGTSLDEFSTAKSAFEFLRARKRGGLLSISGIKLLLSTAVFPASLVAVTKPPLPWYKVFEIPRHALNAEEGVEMVCQVSDVPAKDGSLVDVDVSVRYYIDLNSDLQRYLSLCGPVPPSGQVGRVVGYCVRSHAANADAGIILSAQRREKYFVGEFTRHCKSKLLADCAVRVLSVRIDRAKEVAEGGFEEE